MFLWVRSRTLYQGKYRTRWLSARPDSKCFLRVPVNGCWLLLVAGKSSIISGSMMCLCRRASLSMFRDHSARSRHKIQDFHILPGAEGPLGGGVVYTFAPVDDLHKVPNVHRNMLKTQVRPGHFAHPPRTPSPHALVVSDDNSSNEGNLWLLVPETPLPPIVAVPNSSGAMGPPMVTCGSLSYSGYTYGAWNVLVRQFPFLSPMGQASFSQLTLCQTCRSTASQHSYVHHLPLTIGEVWLVDLRFLPIGSPVIVVWLA